MSLLAKLYDFLGNLWQSHQTDKIISRGLIVGFLIGLTIVALSRNLDIHFFSTNTNYFLAINIAFQILLIIEILGLIFVLPKSVADSVGKQFEILSIILLRSAFKEFGNFNHPVEWSAILYDPLFHMLSDAFGALVIFLIIGFYYKKQKHEKITKTEKEQDEFIVFKKVLALVLLILFAYLGIFDIIQFVQTGVYVDSFNTFYTVLIFTDILILLFTLRYSSKYYNLFRYSSFAFATILIRVSLTAPPYMNILIGITAGLFVLGLTVMYNYFIEKSP
ncbi:hypothetical protein [Ekhidna sp.]|uniref:hypothetical protein n=1 Tax=Ekhidna sp. TaxID=2608089 RepID=UPI003297FAA2